MANSRENRRLTAAIPSVYQERFEKERLQINVERMLGFAIYIVVLQIVLQITNMLYPQGSGGGMEIPLICYIVLSLTTLLIGIVYWVLLALAKKHKTKNHKSRAFLVQSLLYIYYLIQMAFCTLNVLSHQGVNGQIILILLFGMVPILKPIQSATSIIVSFVYTLILLLLTRGIVGANGLSAWDKLFQTDMRAYFIIINGFTILISFFIYRLYVSNFLRGMELERNNADLERAVYERTAELEEKTVAAEAASLAKSRFLASMSHEIRTPLNAITGMAHVAKKAESKEKANAAIEEITAASSLLLGLLNNILDMSDIESGKLKIEEERFPLRRAMEEVISLAEIRCAEKAITFVHQLEGLPDVALTGDKIRLKQVLISLLDNAVKYTPEDGRVELVIRATEETEDHLSLFFSVTDSGVGMTDEQMAQLFTAFEQGMTSRMKNVGAGLGLALSQSLMTLMGGRISVSSTPDQGSVFSCEIRLPKDKTVQEEPQLTVPNLSGKHILSAEDIDINRVILAEFLAETNAEIDEAVDGLDAVDKFKASPEGYYSLVFMDLLMPNMDGFEATRSIRHLEREDAATVPIVALSANAYPEDIDQSFQAGMNGHLAKPIDFVAIMRLLTEKVVPQTTQPQA